MILCKGAPKGDESNILPPTRMGRAEVGQAPGATQGSVDESVRGTASVAPFPGMFVHQPRLLGLLPCFGLSQLQDLDQGVGGIKEADALSEGCLLLLHLPALGILGEAGGRVPGLLFTRVEAPESRDWSALASGNTERVRARVQVWVCVCAFFAYLFRELRSRIGGGWQWDVKFTVTQRWKESGGRARRAPDWGNLSVGDGGINHTGWRSSVVRC